MAIDAGADFKAIMGDLDIIGVTVAATVGAATVNGLFMPYHLDVEGVESVAPSLVLADSDITAQSIARETTITVEGSDYLVKGVEPSGWGRSRLVLEKV